MTDWLYHWVVSGVDVVLAVQNVRAPVLDAVFRAATFLGTDAAYFLLLPFFYWLVNPSFGRRLSYIFVTVVYWNTFFKNLFGLPRPADVDSRVVPLVAQGGYGLPSGHAMDSLVLWGYIAREWRRRGGWVTAGAAALVAAIAFSRIYLGVHFPADVIAGLLLGAVVLVAFLYLYPPLANWLARQEDRLALALGIALPIVLLFGMPGDANGYPAAGATTIAGVLLGLNVGFFFETRRVRFGGAATLPQLAGRYVVGLIFVAAFWLGLRLLFGFIPGGYGVQIALRFVRYALTGCALGWWAPAAFVKLGLAESKPPASDG